MSSRTGVKGNGWIRPRITAALVAIAALPAVSCQGDARSDADLPPAPPVVVVTMREYDFDYAGTVPAGRVIFRLVNAGDVEHHPSLLPLPEDLPPIADQVRGSERRVLLPFAGVFIREPGESGTFAVDLVPGQRYAFLCYMEGPDGESHVEKGMYSEFRAEAAEGGSTGWGHP